MSAAPESPSEQSQVVARAVTYRHPQAEKDCLHGIDLALAGGELVCVIGPNGGGKSTLLRLMAGLIEPSGGGIELNGSSVRRLAPRARARAIALVPQGLARLPRSLVRDFVAGGRYSHLGRFGTPGPEDRAAVDTALESAELTSEARRPMAELSGGQRQRALIARALAQDSPLLLVDEPTNSLDPAHQLSIFELIAGQACLGRAVVVVTHDLNLASQFATRLCLLDAGRILCSGRPDEVLRPEVLEPVYGSRMHFGELPSSLPPGVRPFVLPWSS